MSFRARLRTAAALAVTVAALAAGAGAAAAEDIAPGTTAQSYFQHTGPHPVATTVRTNPCQDSIFGMVQHIVVHAFGNRDNPTCTQAFPNGLESPIGVNTYYPADLSAPAPLLVFVPGINANPGMYDALARQWVSHGFVVVIPYDYVNSLAHVPALGLATAVLANRDPSSPLHGRIDLGRTVFGGHSAGGQAALQAGAALPRAAAAIDPELRVAGVLAIEPGPLAVGALIEVPTLFLTGYNDFVVPDFAWVRWWQYNLHFNAPPGSPMPMGSAISRRSTAWTPTCPRARRWPTCATWPSTTTSPASSSSDRIGYSPRTRRTSAWTATRGPTHCASSRGVGAPHPARCRSPV
ncbi:hypothetical protein AB0H76_00190 [Nocardia sp. NPDC050712]|uniref:poly(ethylene terephthalate) hydrolase family protein n=1 Tax=Nocardia sp. NPDC050712 TaxID=3155518 RepID=UPI0033F08CA6